MLYIVFRASLFCSCLKFFSSVILGLLGSDLAKILFKVIMDKLKQMGQIVQLCFQLNCNGSLRRKYF